MNKKIPLHRNMLTQRCVACFKNITEFNTPRKNIYDYNFHRGCNFYEVHKFKIQEAMENRALKQILENVIQDENFIALFD